MIPFSEGLVTVCITVSMMWCSPYPNVRVLASDDVMMTETSHSTLHNTPP